MGGRDRARTLSRRVLVVEVVDQPVRVVDHGPAVDYFQNDIPSDGIILFRDGLIGCDNFNHFPRANGVICFF